MPKLSAMSDSSPTGANSVVLKMKAAIASVTTRSHATLRETVFVIIGSELVTKEEEEVSILKRLLVKIQSFCDLDLTMASGGIYKLTDSFLYRSCT